VNCVISCFKWFSNVLLRLKPSACDFSTSSLSMYKTKLCLFLKCIYTRGRAKGVLCYMFGHSTISIVFVGLNFNPQTPTFYSSISPSFSCSLLLTDTGQTDRDRKKPRAMKNATRCKVLLRIFRQLQDPDTSLFHV
jgi:hypothetical protein